MLLAFRCFKLAFACKSHHIVSAYLSTFAVRKGMELQEIVKKFEKFAPTSLAEDWDNVGLLVQPSGLHVVKKLIITNDLTESVLEESIARKVDMIISYHPPIFQSLKKLTSSSVKERIIVRAIENRLAIYSPHTIYDSLKGGVTDWLISGFGDANVQPIMHGCDSSEYTYKLDLFINQRENELWRNFLQNSDGIEQIAVSKLKHPPDSLKFEVKCSKVGMLHVFDFNDQRGDENVTVQICSLTKRPTPHAGAGRICHLLEPLSLEKLIGRIKKHLKVQSVRLAMDSYKPLSILDDSERKHSISKKIIHTVAVVAGSGASLLKDVRADLYVTGEMSHHNILDAVGKGICVLLCEHTHTERGYLFGRLKNDITTLLDNKVEIITADTDGDPLAIV